MSEYSGKRLENRILETISTMIVNGMIKNPNLSRFTSITEVDLSSDNANATVYVSCADERGLDRIKLSEHSIVLQALFRLTLLKS